MRSFNVATESTVTDRDIAYWVITAFEGGISYWCDAVKPVQRDENGHWQTLKGEAYDQYVEDGVGAYANPEFWDGDVRGYMLFDPYEQKWCDYPLTMNSLLKALKYQPPKRNGVSPNWFRKVVSLLVSGDYDAEDADTLVQIAVFREVVYG